MKSPYPSVKCHGIPRFMERGVTLKIMEFHGIFHGIPWNSSAMEPWVIWMRSSLFHGIPWNSAIFYLTTQGFRGIIWNNPRDSNETQWQLKCYSHSFVEYTPFYYHRFDVKYHRPRPLFVFYRRQNIYLVVTLSRIMLLSTVTYFKICCYLWCTISFEDTQSSSLHLKKINTCTAPLFDKILKWL